MSTRLWLWNVAICCAASARLFGQNPNPTDNPGAQTPPMPTNSVSVADLVRRILALSPAEREAYLASKKPEHRVFLEAKFTEYDALTPAEREKRLRTAQLRYYLSPLIRLAPTNRAARIATIPEPDRALVIERIRLWDALPPSDRGRFLAYEVALRATAETNNIVLAPTTYTRAERERLERELAELNALPGSQRDEMRNQFQRVFTLESNKLEKAFTVLSQSERIALQRIAHLPKEQRDQVLAGFEKFVRLPAEERAEYLKAADRWQTMSEMQRAHWREVTRQLPPRVPLPGVFSFPPTPMGVNLQSAPRSVPPFTTNPPDR